MYLHGSKRGKYEKVYMTSFLLILVTHLPNQRPEIITLLTLSYCLLELLFTCKQI